MVITETSFSAGPLKTIETEKSLFSGRWPATYRFTILTGTLTTSEHPMLNIYPVPATKPYAIGSFIEAGSANVPKIP